MTTPVVFVTANVGSIFEEPTEMLQIWAKEFLSTVNRLNAKFVALHCQEVGGKNYEKSMQFVGNFVELLIDSKKFENFNRARIYLDEDFSSAEKFTALGNFYFIHETVDDARVYDFSSGTFETVVGKEIYNSDIDQVTTMEKSKFPLEFFPECKWSRKGFLRTRWSINGTIFDLVNIHLFHDASNFVAIETFPSEYCETRRQALIYTLDRFQTDGHESVPLFIFGDFNFRTDTQGVVKRLSRGLSKNPSESGDNDSRVEYLDENERKMVLSLGKKHFSHLDHQDIFGKHVQWLKEFDRELEAFRDQLFEFGITFQPSYPFEEGQNNGEFYMKTRCPAWCDRVLLSKSALPLVKDYQDATNVEYGLIGSQSCMGDHKPVYLRIEIASHIAKDDLTDWRPIAPIEEPADRNRTDELLDKSVLVKRVNSASLVESHSRREDWKNSRCHSDVSWNPVTTREFHHRKKPFLREPSRMRLISNSSTIHLCLPRLTSHHSSSDEEWFETIEDDDVLNTRVSEEDQALADQMKVIIADEEPKKGSNSINKRLKNNDEGRKRFFPKFFRRRASLKKEPVTSSWESIDIRPPEVTKEVEPIPVEKRCCVLQ